MYTLNFITITVLLTVADGFLVRDTLPVMSTGYTTSRLITLQNQLTLSTTTAMAMSPITTHVLDTARGCPAGNLQIELSKLTTGEGWTVIKSGRTNSDGRVSALLTQDEFTVGTYKMRFETGGYFQQNHEEGFYPYVEIVFEIKDVNQHYHVPLLLSPFGYTTYRGS